MRPLDTERDTALNSSEPEFRAAATWRDTMLRAWPVALPGVVIALMIGWLAVHPDAQSALSATLVELRRTLSGGGAS